MTIKGNELLDKRILLIDDDAELLKLLDFAFTQAGCMVYTATDGQQGLQQVFDYRPNLIILDLILPLTDGWEVCRMVRQLSQIPIIILTGLGEKEHIIRGLEEGADDYVMKPFDMEILLAKVRAILRRAAFPTAPNYSLTYNDGYLTIDLDKRQVLVHGQPADLTKTEYKLLAYLFQHAGQVLPYHGILENTWGWDKGQERIVHIYISRLRQKLEKNPKQPDYILTEHGIGYRFQKQNNNFSGAS
jgi:DNA-binding response OmpR family regulator